MAPLRYAMGLVDYHKVDRSCSQLCEKILISKTLRRDEDKVGALGFNLFQILLLLGGGKRAIQL